MRVIIQPNYEKVSQWAANYVARKILDFEPTLDKPFVLGLPTGSSPIGMYRELAATEQGGQAVVRARHHVQHGRVREACRRTIRRATIRSCGGTSSATSTSPSGT